LKPLPRIPASLFVAFAASFGIHLAFLFGPAIRLKTESRPPPIEAELRPARKTASDVSGEGEALKNTSARTGNPPHAQNATSSVGTPTKKPGVATERPERRARAAKKAKAAPNESEKKAREAHKTGKPDAESAASGAETTAFDARDASDDFDGSSESDAEISSIPSFVEAVDLPDDAGGASRSVGGILGDSRAPQRLPRRGRIDYRVDYGDRGFEAGKATSEWTIADGRYHLKMDVETVGLAWLFKPYRIVMESRGRILPEGLVPERFSVLRNGEDAGEKADFDWRSMTVTVGKRGRMHSIESGTQDLLSFNFHLGFMRHPVIGSRLPLVTGKKYGVHFLEKVGDETIETPLGALRALHLRAPGASRTELWLAYDYLLLPVRIRFVDSRDESFVQTVSGIWVGDSETTGAVETRGASSSAETPEASETFGSSEGG
jgi:hypothetical protein